jgi:peptide/nickel transport system substrate-binding protein
LSERKIGLPTYVISLAIVAIVVGASVYYFVPRPVPETEDVIYVGLSYAPTTIVSGRYTGVVEQTIAWQLYDRLIEIDENMNLIPGLATSWNVSADGKTWTFVLREGVTFHDGTAFNASAVKMFFDHLLHPDNRAYYIRGYRLVSDINTVDVLDDYVVAFTTNETYVPFLTNLAYANSGGIFSPSALLKYNETELEQHPIGTGPFKLLSNIPGERLEMVANDDYWGGRPEIDKLVFLVITEASTRVTALLTGDIDFAHAVPLPDYDALVADPTITVETQFERMMFVPINNYLYNKQIRQAINYAVNKTAIIEVLFGGNADYTKSPVPPLNTYANNICVPYYINITKAQELMTAAGTTGFVTNLTTTSGRYPFDLEVCQIIQANLAEINITVNIIVEESGVHFGSYLTPLPEDYPPMAFQGWGTSTGDPDYFTRSWYWGNISKAEGNYGPWYDNVTVDALLSDAMEETNSTIRAELYDQAWLMLWEDAPFLWLYTQPSIVAYRANIEGINYYPSDAYSFRYASIS